jgi:hypothetical protein
MAESLSEMLRSLIRRISYLEAAGMASGGAITPPVTLGTGASAATWPSSYFGDGDYLRGLRGTAASPVASSKAVVTISSYTSGDWADADMAEVMVYSLRTGGSSNAIMAGAVSGAKGKSATAIQGHTAIDSGTGTGTGDHASVFSAWLTAQLWSVYDNVVGLEINPTNCTASDPPNDGEYGSTGLCNALSLIAAGSKKASSALVIGTQSIANAQFQRGIDMAQSSISTYAMVYPNNTPITARNAADNAKVELYRLDASNNWGVHAMTLTEQTAPGAPAANQVTIYAVDNGSGKTQLMALFATGAAQQLAIQP